MSTAAFSVFIVKFWPVVIGVVGLASAALFGWIKTKPAHHDAMPAHAGPFSAHDSRAVSRDAASGATRNRAAKTKAIDDRANRL